MRNTVVLTYLFIYAFIFFNTRWCHCNENSPNTSIIKCKPYERAALLNFMHNLTYFNKDVSSSWKGEECCNWSRVGCDNTTGHILKLHLYGDDSNHLLKMESLESLVYFLELRRLESLDLSYNDFSYSSIPTLMGSMKQLMYLDLSYSSIGGFVPHELGNLTNLQVLQLSINNLSGEIPTSLGKLSNLNSLDISDNKLSGEILAIIKKLPKLQGLDISYNPLEGTILSEADFANLSSLTNLLIGETMVTLNLSSDWVPPFQLREFGASNINGRIPPWLQTQKNLESLYLSNANISGFMPTWFHTMQQLKYVYLYNNHLSGFPIFPLNFDIVDLSNNLLSGEFSSVGSKNEVYAHAVQLYLSDNKLSGPIPEGLAYIMPNLKYVDLSNNQISGQIPNSLCQLTSLSFLNIKHNSLSGVIPNCWANVSSLYYVGLSHNLLKGRIPCFNNTYSNKNLYNSDIIEFKMHLNDNMLSGEIPSCLSNLTNLKVLDIGGNQLSGKMLKWFSAEKFRELQILRLGDNKLSGSIPRQICSLPQLQIMDLRRNLFTGVIPPCLSNLTAMTSPNASRMTEINNAYSMTYDVSEVILGVERAYTSTLPYLVDIDLSSNNISGSIPDDITKISGLLNLNLSYNLLSGIIPVNIGGLSSLVSLDLSNNKLRGSIPPSIGEIYRLGRLNLSYNNLSSPIPTGNQLQTLSDQALIYAGNPYLCGDFLPKKCKRKVDKQDKGTSNNGKGNNKKKLEKMGLELVVMSGFATGFWGVVGGGLVLNRRWRHAVFRRVEDGYNWLYVVVAVRVAKARRINSR